MAEKEEVSQKEGYWSKRVTIRRWKLVEFGLQYSMFGVTLLCVILMIYGVFNIILLGITHYPEMSTEALFVSIVIFILLWMIRYVFTLTRTFNFRWEE